MALFSSVTEHTAEFSIGNGAFSVIKVGNYFCDQSRFPPCGSEINDIKSSSQVLPFEISLLLLLAQIKEGTFMKDLVSPSISALKE